MNTQQEVIYECGPEDDFEKIESADVPNQEEVVSYIKQLEESRYIDHFFQVGPRTEDETLSDRYNRLRSEMILLHDRIREEQLKRGNCNSQNIESLQNFLSALNVAERQASEFVDPDAHRLANLNKRVSELEWTLGIDSTSSQQSATPIFKELEDLKVRVTLLTTDLVHKIHKRIKENAQANSARSDVSVETSYLRDENQSGLTEMHELVKNWDKRCKEIPNIVDHLATTRTQQQDASRVIKKYAKLSTIKTDIEKTLAFQRELDTLNKKRNEHRLNEIKQRISSLKTN
ncbi:hypothetical protein M3Y94_00751300 [Aphelenchoides besseyi]|nr:hypothetical protein M3Y94_00751300 [Aphelenchoides besseyi]KAI6232076.1 hypothetical protein M3Y95_00448800 [Aphelenchoides besseyi]